MRRWESQDKEAGGFKYYGVLWTGSRTHAGVQVSKCRQALKSGAYAEMLQASAKKHGQVEK